MMIGNDGRDGYFGVQSHPLEKSTIGCWWVGLC